MFDQAVQRQAGEDMTPDYSGSSISPKLAATAKYIRSKDPNIGQVKLQKILYFIQGYSQSWTGKPLFVDLPEAWVMGPVYREVRTDIEHRDSRQVDRADITLLGDTDKAIIDAVFQRCREMSGQQLKELSHKLPWQKARGDIPETAPSDKLLDRQDMLEFFLGADVQRWVERPDFEDEWEMPSEDFLASERQRWARALEILGS